MLLLKIDLNGESVLFVFEFDSLNHLLVLFMLLVSLSSSFYLSLFFFLLHLHSERGLSRLTAFCEF